MTKKRKTDVHFSSASNEWQTPRWLFDQLNAEFGFELDAAATAENALCPRYYTAEMDALKQDWSDGGVVKTVWTNPPYGKVGPLFIRHAHQQTVLHPELTVVMLVPARPDTKVWHECCAAGEVRFLKGRLSFVDPIAAAKKSPAPFPSAILVLGARARAATTLYVEYKEPKGVVASVTPVECITPMEAPVAS